MITSAQIKLIGHINKPHGIHGEMSATIECDIEELRLFKCIIFEIDGIFVPFFISTLRPRGSQSALISIDGVISDEHAAEFANKEIYALKKKKKKFEKDTEIKYTRKVVKYVEDTDDIINGVKVHCDCGCIIEEQLIVGTLSSIQEVVALETAMAEEEDNRV